MTVSAMKLGGLIVPSCLWVASTQISQILPHMDCARQSNWLVIVDFGFVLIGLAATLLSYRARTGPLSQTGSFLAKVSLLVGLAFVFALVLQGAAAVLLSPCQRW